MTEGYVEAAACRPFAPKGANPSSHGETIAGLDRSLKADASRRREAVARGEP